MANPFDPEQWWVIACAAASGFREVEFNGERINIGPLTTAFARERAAICLLAATEAEMRGHKDVSETFMAWADKETKGRG